MNVQIRVDIPVLTTGSEESVRYLRARPEPAACSAIKVGEELTLATATSIKPRELPTRKSMRHFVVLHAACEDRLQNYYQFSTYFEVHRTEAFPESLEPALIRRYEETRFIPSSKRSQRLTDDFGFVEPSLDAMAVLTQRYR